MLWTPYLVLVPALVATAIIMACGWRQVSGKNPPSAYVYFGNQVELVEGYVRTWKRRYFWGQGACRLVVVVETSDSSTPIVQRLSREYRTFLVLPAEDASWKLT